MTNGTTTAYHSRSPIVASAIVCVALVASLAQTIAASLPTPATPAAATPTATQSPPAAETSAIVVDNAGVLALLGEPVRSVKGEDLGKVVDVVVDHNGQILAAIVDFGGFLGVGSRKIAVDWRILHFPPDGAIDKLIVDLPRDRLRDAPTYKAGEPIVIIGPAAPASSAESPKPTATLPAAPGSDIPAPMSGAPKPTP